MKEIALVQHYINCRKSVEVKIAIRNERDLLLLQKAYIDAVN